MTQYTMQAQASDSKLLYYWGSSSRDYAGAGYPGTGTPQEVAVAAFQPADVSGVVDSFNGRTGVVSPQAGDYDAADILDLTAANVEFDPSANPLSATDVQGAIEELTTKPATVKAGNGDYTLEAGDIGQIVSSNVLVPATFTVTDSASFPVGSIIEVVQEAAGQLTLAEGAGTTIKRSRFATLELGGEGSTVRLRKQSAGIWIASGDLKETQPRAVITLDNVSVSGAGNQIDVTAVQGQGGAPPAWQLEADGSVTCLISGFYNFSGSLVIEDSNTSSSRNTGLGIRRNGATVREIAGGVRESSSASVDIKLIVYGWVEYAAGDELSVGTNSGSTTSFPGNTASRQFWVTRLSD